MRVTSKLSTRAGPHKSRTTNASPGQLQCWDRNTTQNDPKLESQAALADHPSAADAPIAWVVRLLLSRTSLQALPDFFEKAFRYFKCRMALPWPTVSHCIRTLFHSTKQAAHLDTHRHTFGVENNMFPFFHIYSLRVQPGFKKVVMLLALVERA